jgi:hypothetical protein
MPDKTDRALKDGLNGNSLARERLIIDLLNLEPQYSRLEPRRPEGGPDGGRDIQGIHQEIEVVWGAIGFVNNASDTNAERNQIFAKYKADLSRALQEKPDLKAFVFATNCDIRPAEQQKWIKHAKEKGILSVELYWREKLRARLDTPAAYGIRLKYLEIEMSGDEQVAFFSGVGSELQELLISQKTSTERMYERVEFRFDAVTAPTDCNLNIMLDKEYKADEIPEIILFIPFNGILDQQIHKSLFFAVRDKKGYGERIGLEAIIGSPPTISCRHNGPRTFAPTLSSYTVEQINFAPFLKSLRDFDERLFQIYTTKSSLSVIRRLSFIVNEYVIFDMPISARDFVEIKPPEQTKVCERLKDVRDWMASSQPGSERPQYWRIDFSNSTPRKRGRGNMFRNRADHFDLRESESKIKPNDDANNR